jgi:hypothetical protein
MFSLLALRSLNLAGRDDCCGEIKFAQRPFFLLRKPAAPFCVVQSGGKFFSASACTSGVTSIRPSIISHNSAPTCVERGKNPFRSK